MGWVANFIFGGSSSSLFIGPRVEGIAGLLSGRDGRHESGFLGVTGARNKCLPVNAGTMNGDDSPGFKSIGP